METRQVPVPRLPREAQLWQHWGMCHSHAFTSIPRPTAAQRHTHINEAHIGGGHRELESPERKAETGSGWASFP